MTQLPPPPGMPAHPARSRRLGVVVAIVLGVVVLAMVGVTAAAVLVVVKAMPDDETAEDAARDIAEALAQGDYNGLCEMYSDDARADAFDARQFESCADMAEWERVAHGDGVEMRVLDVDQDGDEATVTYTVRSGLAEQTDELTLARRDGEWEMDAVADLDPRDHPSHDDLAGPLGTVVGLDEDAADCVADELLASDLTDAELQALIDDEVLSKEETRHMVSVFTAAAAACHLGPPPSDA